MALGKFSRGLIAAKETATTPADKTERTTSPTVIPSEFGYGSDCPEIVWKGNKNTKIMFQGLDQG